MWKFLHKRQEQEGQRVRLMKNVADCAFTHTRGAEIAAQYVSRVDTRLVRD